MEYNKIIAVTGMPGLYELLTSKSDGAIVKSLIDKTNRFVASRTHSFSHLESIEVYTVDGNVNLVDIFNAMKASTEARPDGKDNGVVKKYFEKVYPNLDFERVYSSDMKKMVKWFDLLTENNIEFKVTEEEAEAETEAEPAVEVEKEEPVAEAKPKKAAAKKAAPKAEAGEAAEEKPKKAARKKKSEE